jgi:hypothetical protein
MPWNFFGSTCKLLHTTTPKNALVCKLLSVVCKIESRLVEMDERGNFEGGGGMKKRKI